MAFVRHLTPRDNTDGRNHAKWARNRRSDDYELLCKGGGRADIDDWEKCHLGKVPANAIVTGSKYKITIGQSVSQPCSLLLMCFFFLFVYFSLFISFQFSSTFLLSFCILFGCCCLICFFNTLMAAVSPPFFILFFTALSEI